MPTPLGTTWIVGRPRRATSDAIHGGAAVLRDPPHGIKAILKTSLLRISSGDGAVRPRRSLTIPQRRTAPIRRSRGRPNELLLYDVRQHAHRPRSFPDRPPAANSGCHGRALRAPALDAGLREKAGGARRDRTDDLMLAKHALSQLSYGPGR